MHFGQKGIEPRAEFELKTSREKKILDAADKKDLMTAGFFLILALVYWSFFPLETLAEFMVSADKISWNFLGADISGEIFLNIASQASILIVPLILVYWKFERKDKTSAQRLSMAFALIAVASALLALSALTLSDGRSSVLWLSLGILIYGFGETLVLPTVYAAVTRIAPARFRATMVGILMASAVIAAPIIQPLSKLVENVPR